MNNHENNNYNLNHKYNEILKSDCLSTVLISAPKGQGNRTVYAPSHARAYVAFFLTLLAKITLRISCVLMRIKKAYNITNFVVVIINW